MQKNTKTKCIGNAYFSQVMLDPVIRVNKGYYPKILLEEQKYETKKTKMENCIDDDLDLSLSTDESDNESDNEIESDNYE